MKTYKVTLHIAASSPQELEEKLQAFQDLQDHLSHGDFIQAATVVVENPALIEFIKGSTRRRARIVLGRLFIHCPKSFYPFRITLKP